MRKTTLDSILGKPLATAIKRVANSNFDNLTDPAAREFRAHYESYRDVGKDLIENHLPFYLTGMFRSFDLATVHEYGLIAVCYGKDHQYPHTVAKLSVSKAALDKFPTLEESVAAYPFRHSDLRYSHHTEAVEGGKIFCECGQEAVVKPISRIYRLIPVQKNKQGLEQEVAKALAKKYVPDDPRAAKTMLKQLQAAFGVGTTFDTLYDALEQTRFYAVTIDDLLRKPQLKGKRKIPAYQTFHKGTMLGNIFEAGHLGDFVKTIVDLIGKEGTNTYIRPPFVSIHVRTKGQTFADKVMLNKHTHCLNDGLKDGTLSEYLQRFGIQVEEAAPDGHFRQRDLRDFLGMQFITHGDALTYNGRFGYEPPGESVGQQRVYDFFHINFPWMIKTARMNRRGLSVYVISPDNASERAGIIIQPNDIEDYIESPKKSGYKALHLTAFFSYLNHGDQPIAVEIQIKSNYMDNLAEQSSRQNHDRMQYIKSVLGGYLVERGCLTQTMLDVARRLMSPNMEYRMAEGTRTLPPATK